jgi:hypothetical protein
MRLLTGNRRDVAWLGVGLLLCALLLQLKHAHDFVWLSTALV